MTDLVDLVHRAQQELPYRFSAYEALVRMQLGGVRRLARGIVHDADTADSIAQDVMLRMLHGLRGLAEAERFPAWLHRITVNVCRSHLAREAREASKRRNLQSELAGDADAATVPERSPTDTDRFAAMLRPLGTDERTVVCLKLLQDLEFGEIAEITGLGLSAVKMRYYRALEKTRSAMDDET